MKKPPVTLEQEQEVFERAREYLELDLGMRLGLSQLLELKSVWVAQVARDFEMTTALSDSDFAMPGEAAARFVLHNFNVDPRFVSRTFGLGRWPAENSLELIYLRMQCERAQYL